MKLKIGKSYGGQLFAAIAGLTVGASLANAQASQQEGIQRATLEEVIVTAQRKEQSAQDVAISITVFNQEDIANANMTNSNDIATYTPSLTTNTRFGPENATFSIRGFTRSLRTTASVGVYFAEVIAPRGQTSQTSGDGAGPGSLFDLQNIQVLKGPQGTLFGRNTTGGSILLVPAMPSDEFEAYAEYSAGNYDSKRRQAVVNVPITDNFRIRFGVDDNEREGHLNNITNIGSDKLGNVDYTAARLSLLWNITDELENYTIISHVDSETAGYTSRLFACNNEPADAFGVIIGTFTNAGCNQQLEMQRSTGQDGYYDIVSTVKTPITTIKEKRFINTTTWDLSAGITLKNILAYAHLETENGSDIFGTRFPEITGGLLPLPIGIPGAYDPNREFSVGVSIVNPNYPVTSQETWVEEIQIQGLSSDSRLEWQAGLYYENSIPDGPSGNTSAGTISCDNSTLEGDPSEYNCFDISAGLLGSVIINEFETEYINKAVYAQASYDFLESLSATLGLRYTWDETIGYGKKTRYPYIGEIQQQAIVQVTEPKQESEAPTGLLEVQYRPINDVMLYAKYIRGYRQGSVNAAVDPGIDTFEAEKVDTYEIGAKTSFGGPVPGRFNIALFDNNFTNMQLQTGYISNTSAQTVAIFNAGRSEIKGIEAEVFLQLLDGLNLSLSYSKLDTELLEQEDSRAKVEAAAGTFGGFTATPIADEGDELPFAPKSSWVASLTYNVPVPLSLGVVDLGLTYVYTGEQRAAASSTSPFAMLPEYSLLNMNAAWYGIFGSGFDLSLYATNVRDKEYATYVSGTYTVLGFESRMSGLPKMYGARLRYTF